MTFLRRNLWPIGVLVLLPILMLLPALLPGKALLPAAMLGNMIPWKSLAVFPQPTPWNPLQFDGIAQFYPWRLFAAETLRSGYLPLWNPFQFCGTPFLANDQSAVLYPPNLLFVVMPVAQAFGASAVLHLALTGIFMYALLRRHVGVMPALLGAIVWQLSTWQIGWLALPTFLCTSTWIPLALLQIERCAEKPSAERGVALGGILGLMLLAGHLQIALYGLLVCAAYALTHIARANANARAGLLGACALGAIVSLLLFSPQILPTLELAHVSHRAGGAHPTLAGYHSYLATRMRLEQLVTLFSPGFFGRLTELWGFTNFAENACFIGIAGVVAAIAGMFGMWRGPEQLCVRFFACVAVAAMLIALGTPLAGALFFGVPGFGQTGSPARILVLWTLAMATLAAFGLEYLQTRPMPKAAAWTAFALLIAPLVGAVNFVQALPPVYMSVVNKTDIVESLVAAVLVCVAVAVMRKPGAVRSATAAFVLLAGLDLFRAGFGYNLSADSAQVYPATPGIAFLQAHASDGRIAVVNPENAVYSRPGVLPPNAATVYGIRDLQGYDSLQTGRYKAFVNGLDQHDSSPVENGNMTLTNATAALNPGERDLDGAAWIVSSTAVTGLTPIATGDSSVLIYAVPGAELGRARTVSSAGADSGRVAIDTDLPTRLEIRTHVAGDLVLLDQWYPGWRATVNGNPAAIAEGPDVFRTVRDVPSNAVVTMQYTPDSFRLGMYLLCFGALVIVATATIAAVSRPSPTPNQ